MSEITTQHLIWKLQKNAAAALEKIEKKLADPDDKASLSQLGVLTGIMLDKKQLLEEKPTQIVSQVQRMEVGEVTKLLLEEMKRRGLDAPMIDVEAREVG